MTEEEKKYFEKNIDELWKKLEEYGKLNNSMEVQNERFRLKIEILEKDVSEFKPVILFVQGTKRVVFFLKWAAGLIGVAGIIKMMKVLGE